ncbi:hypothetical protein RM190_19710 [Paracoccus sp. CPCC 101403]|uniref:Uncharacterized protein n=2 Tax=Paracoccus broussonetiae TaxID=3075834 RepID=A0ABU3EIM3_9RHOB|nr:hypothetical protein [Paracoccus sp. CPCC 101403]MDT1064099.1 hypothetical protein [Paracoccus sp. CPCC 101403]
MNPTLRTIQGDEVVAEATMERTARYDMLVGAIWSGRCPTGFRIAGAEANPAALRPAGWRQRLGRGIDTPPQYWIAHVCRA